MTKNEQATLRAVRYSIAAKKDGLEGALKRVNEVAALYQYDGQIIGHATAKKFVEYLYSSRELIMPHPQFADVIEECFWIARYSGEVSELECLLKSFGSK